MDSSTSARGRGRKRHTLPITLPYNSSEVTEQPSTETPSANMATRSFTFDTPSPSASRETRMRTRHIDGANASPEDPTSKGGRSLRKRPRVDYTFDNVEETDNHGAKATPTTTRAIKRRKPDFPTDNDTAEDVDSRTKRRASEQPQSSSTRRRNYMRKSTAEPQTYVPELQMDDVEVQDTIEVGGHHSSESDESILRRASSGSSNNDSRVPLNNTSLSTSLDMLRTSQRMDYLQTNQRSTLGAIQADHLHDLQQDVEDEDIEDEDDEEDEAEDVDDGPVNRVSLTHLDHLTPYIRGSYIYYPELYDDEPEADADVNSEADSDTTHEADAAASPEVGPDADDTADQGLKLDIANEDATQQDTVAKDVATGYPTAITDDKANGSFGDTPAETAANTPSAAAEPTNTQNAVKNQFHFNQLRPASEFLDLFSDIKSLPIEELYYRTEVANRCLVAWQEEFNELRKLTDDHDNSIRYQREEEAFERRVQAAVEKDPTANPERAKDFVVKGIRAEKEYTYDQAYTRQQDRIMANAYGFEYKPDAKLVGEQDPSEQREDLYGRNGRLRRGKKTPKAAEAEDSAQGKRPRKAAEKSNGGGAANRDSSPVPSQRRGRRTAQTQENTDLNSNQQKPEPVEQEPPKKKGRGGRPRKNPLPEPVIPTPAAEPEPNVEPEPQLEAEPKSKPKARSKAQAKSQAKSGPKATRKSEVEPLSDGKPELEQKSSPKRGAEQMEEQKQPARKRRRQTPAASTLATTTATEDVHDGVANGTESRAIAKPSPRRKNSRKVENLPGSFNSAYSATSVDQGEETRPLTASSTATVATVASTSNYSLREKRQRKFTNDVDDDFIEEPKPKRARAAPKKQTRIKNVTAASEPAPAQQPEPKVVPVPKVSKIIKLKVPSSASTSRGHSVVPSANPANPVPAPTTGSNVTGNTNGYVVSNGAVDHGAPADGAEAPKDYSAMTKSEKMSASMKARWNSGSMNGAVQKRRATLAAKKQSAKVPAPTTPTNPEQGQTRAVPSEDTESEDKDGVATEH
ncbi:hypothetical protein F4820DRAFT_443785 [Hypoxylon rubiginosum]|uniref:Uncharacterized protein n=1 Tax=Hypoxylon rubiginosum TaxID=110542 RepID=A0ACB9ZDJ2_9PEZI|nr:hypothetical protein F4820DRAFT_443785 [Hypoxylon rubiginosum]